MRKKPLTVVPMSRVLHVRDEAQANDLLREFQPELDEEERRAAAWELASGYAMLVLRDEFEQLDVWSHDHEIDDLAPDEPPPPPIPDTREELTWLSFEVVDDRGQRLDGSYVCTIDGRVDDGPLQKDKHAYDDLLESARASLDLRAIVFTEPTPLGPVFPVDPFAPTEHETTTTFEVVDSDDHPWYGEYAILQGDTELHRGDLAGRITVPPELPPPLTLELRTLRRATLGGA